MEKLKVEQVQQTFRFPESDIDWDGDDDDD